MATEEVLASHEATLGDQSPDKLSTHYAEDAVIIINGDTYRGRREIAKFYAKLFRDLPNAKWQTDVAVIHEDLAYVEWSCECATSRVRFGTDTFVVKDGLIARQTASFSVVLDVRQTARPGTAGQESLSREASNSLNQT